MQQITDQAYVYDQSFSCSPDTYQGTQTTFILCINMLACNMKNLRDGKMRPNSFVFLDHSLPRQNFWVAAFEMGRQSFAELLALLPRNHLDSNVVILRKLL